MYRYLFFPYDTHPQDRRVGYTESRTTLSLPRTVEELESMWQVAEKPATAPTWDFMWNSSVDEGRERALLQSAFTFEVETVQPSEPPPDDVQTSESVLKVGYDISDKQISNL